MCMHMRKHTFVVATNQTSRVPRKCGQPISTSFSAELAGTNALQMSLNLISAVSIASYKFRYNERVSSTRCTYAYNPQSHYSQLSVVRFRIQNRTEFFLSLATDIFIAKGTQPIAYRVVPL